MLVQSYRSRRHWQPRTRMDGRYTDEVVGSVVDVVVDGAGTVENFRRHRVLSLVPFAGNAARDSPPRPAIHSAN